MPTDVEYVGGKIFASPLPCGEGGLGSVSEVGWDGSAQRTSTGYRSATNLAVSPDGGVHVVELGVGVFVAGPNGPAQVTKLMGAAAIERAGGRPHASTAPVLVGGKGPGRIVVLR